MRLLKFLCSSVAFITLQSGRGVLLTIDNFNYEPGDLYEKEGGIGWSAKSGWFSVSEEGGVVQGPIAGKPFEGYTTSPGNRFVAHQATEISRCLPQSMWDHLDKDKEEGGGTIWIGFLHTAAPTAMVYLGITEYPKPKSPRKEHPEKESTKQSNVNNLFNANIEVIGKPQLTLLKLSRSYLAESFGEGGHHPGYEFKIYNNLTSPIIPQKPNFSRLFSRNTNLQQHIEIAVDAVNHSSGTRPIDASFFDNEDEGETLPLLSNFTYQFGDFKICTDPEDLSALDHTTSGLVPEPSSIAALGIGLTWLVKRRRKTKTRNNI